RGNPAIGSTTTRNPPNNTAPHSRFHKVQIHFQTQHHGHSSAHCLAPSLRDHKSSLRFHDERIATLVHETGALCPASPTLARFLCDPSPPLPVTSGPQFDAPCCR